MFSLFKHKQQLSFVSFVLLLLLLLDLAPAFQITGALGGIESSGARPFRSEIHVFQHSGAPFDLFILALKQLQSLDQSNPLSYFQIAGIHGYPRIPWDGVSGTGAYPGFCRHASTPFPIWHRPYVALYEQLLWQHAQDIAKAYPDDQRDEYISAALTLRVPYWDWAAHPALPDIVTHPQISVKTPTGQQSIDNPLFTYVFQSGAIGNGFPLFDPMANYSRTVRSWNDTLGFSNQSASNATLLSNAPMILSNTYRILTSLKNYSDFSCALPGTPATTAANIEAIHNSIHDSIGGHGHMAYPEVASFDPIFWLHHAQVDRVFAMWQALNPDSYIEPSTNTFGSYYEPIGYIDSGNTSLAPFHTGNGSNMFTANDVRTVKNFGYAYEELPDWQMDPDQLAANVRTVVNSLYNPSSNSTIRPAVETIRERTANLQESFSYVTWETAKALNVNNLDRQWSIKVLVDRFPLDRSFCIDFFMGDAPNRISAWPTAANLIGTYAHFNLANAKSLYPGGVPQGQVQGEISMTHTLAAGVARGVLRDLSPQCVVPLLKQVLIWKARTSTGDEIPIAELSGLSISVSTQAVVPRTALDQFPQYGPLQWLDSVTEDKPGGAGRARQQT